MKSDPLVSRGAAFAVQGGHVVSKSCVLPCGHVENVSRFFGALLPVVGVEAPVNICSEEGCCDRERNSSGFCNISKIVYILKSLTLSVTNAKKRP